MQKVEPHMLFGGKHITELADEDIAKLDSWSAMRKFQDRANKHLCFSQSLP